MTRPRDIEQITYLDRELVAIIQDFHLLAPLSWPIETQRVFLDAAKKGDMVLPEVSFEKDRKSVV